MKILCLLNLSFYVYLSREARNAIGLKYMQSFSNWDLYAALYYLVLFQKQATKYFKIFIPESIYNTLCFLHTLKHLYYWKGQDQDSYSGLASFFTI